MEWQTLFGIVRAVQREAWPPNFFAAPENDQARMGEFGYPEHAELVFIGSMTTYLLCHDNVQMLEMSRLNDSNRAPTLVVMYKRKSEAFVSFDDITAINALAAACIHLKSKT